jgi:hypothetical protein
MMGIDEKVFRELDKRRRLARPKRADLVSAAVAQSLVSRSGASHDVPDTLRVRTTGDAIEVKGTDAVWATVSVY